MNGSAADQAACSPSLKAPGGDTRPRCSPIMLGPSALQLRSIFRFNRKRAILAPARIPERPTLPPTILSYLIYNRAGTRIGKWTKVYLATIAAVIVLLRTFHELAEWPFDFIFIASPILILLLNRRDG